MCWWLRVVSLAGKLRQKGRSLSHLVTIGLAEFGQCITFLSTGESRRVAVLAQSFTRLSRNALAITDTELKLIAAAAMIGLSRIPNQG